jgi:transcriptional regulator with PAS, ATPase and Fis domain
MIEGNAILTALGMTTHKYDAAELLGTSFRTLRYRINKLRIDESRPSSISTTVKPDYFKHSWKGLSLDEFLNTIEKKVIEMALEETDFKQDAAERLGVSFRTLRYRIDKLGIE